MPSTPRKRTSFKRKKYQRQALPVTKEKKEADDKEMANDKKNTETL